MVRWVGGVSLKERQPSTELRGRIGVVEAIEDVMRRGRLRWHGYVERNGAPIMHKGSRYVLYWWW